MAECRSQRPECKTLRASKLKRKKLYLQLFAKVADIFFRHDPIGINFDTNTDEYHPEVGTVLAKLPHSTTKEEAQKMVHGEFQRWFTPDLAGPLERYRLLTDELWAHWLEHREPMTGKQ